MRKEILGYKNKTNIVNVNFDCFGDVNGNIGKYITESKTELGMFNTENTRLVDGVYIFQDFKYNNIAYRIYKDYADYKYSLYDDYKLISKLQNKQTEIKLSDFPFGVVTIEDKVVGQIIPYYENSDTLFRMFINGNFGTKRPTKYLLEMLKIQKELLSNGIISCDCHPKNFIVKDNTTKAIDFEPGFVFVDEYSDTKYDSMISSLKKNIQYLSNVVNLPIDKINLSNASNIEELEEETSKLDYYTKRLKI